MKKIISIVVISMQLTACATYQSRTVPFRAPQDYTNALNVSGVLIGAEAFSDQAKADEAFGFDVRNAGLLPVQVVLDNQSGQRVQIIPEQSFLVDNSGQYWKMLGTEEAMNRVNRATSGGAIGSGAGRGALYGAAAGTILGMALGIVSGHRVGHSVITGGVLGGAGGAIIGGASSADGRDNSATVYRDMRDKEINGKAIPSGVLANGFIFFPGEATTAQSLRLQISFRASGETRTLMLPFSPGVRPAIMPGSRAPSRPVDD